MTGDTNRETHGLSGLAEPDRVALERFGWTAARDAHWADLAGPGLRPGRVVSQHRGGYEVALAEETVLALLPGRLLRHARRTGERPAVGDWVTVEPLPERGRARIEAILPRTSKFSRRAAGESDAEQVVAANVDVVLLVSALGPDVSPRRLDRYLATAWESGARPAVVLTKLDTVDDPAPFLELVRDVVRDVPLHLVSNLTGEGVPAVARHLDGNRTVALLGSSGVGKSTLVNRLLGSERQPVQAVRADGKGRHTTTHRELIPVPGGGLVLDTPGMRELQLWEVEEGVETSFADVEELAADCRFPDCRHGAEPGCAIRAAVAERRLPAERLDSYLTIRDELESLAERRELRERREEHRAAQASRRAARPGARRS